MKTIFLLILLNSTTVFAQNLIQNGNFKLGTNEWQPLIASSRVTIEKQAIEHSNYGDLYGLPDNYIETSFVELDQQSSLEQTIKTTQTNYTLTFAYSHRPNAGDKKLIVVADNQVIYQKTIKNNKEEGSFIYQKAHFNATNSHTTLEFYIESIEGAADKGVLITDIFCEERVKLDEILEARRQQRYKVK
ncbi:DUF642 domain-containing protein [Aureispira anguillae]|uniref:DUF642 domain-containing protein n=1 Tax=Aureispira anguillae TaxID=2864201 RepID=A0A916DTD2_9BACT|nr:DUF642 domain-containing protein [Aureispira anguillae]BDS11770.1 DUF642 domain-containing protein [Aureispira anguillae]